MAEYHMPGSDDPQFTSLSDFARGYVECALFCGVERPDDDPERDHSKIDDADFSQIAPETLESMTADCVKFEAAAAKLLRKAYRRADYSPEQAGRDFWFTRNGHGVGFWDRSQLEVGDLGRELSDLCGWRTAFGEFNLYMGSDGAIYGMRG